MKHDKEGKLGRGRSYWIGTAALLYFIIALEIVIMISPFAFFFYTVFNPILLGLNHSFLTRWVTAFFLPHMVVPTTLLLIVLRVMGSVFFIGGSMLFLFCAAQVYLGKLLKRGIAQHGFYTLMRHPQYTGLAMAGLGLTILWPRFLTLMFLAVMIFLYYILAKDEERRMLRQYGGAYKEYLEHTGMFWPRFRRKPIPAKLLRWQNVLLLLVALMGGAAALGFGLRAYTVAHLPLETIGGIDILTIIPGDLPLAGGLLQGVLDDSVAAEHLRSIQVSNRNRILVYIVPIDYVMQGMIANTGEEWKLFRQHQTFKMIADYILHPIGHLKSSHMQHAGMKGHDSPQMQRRVIFLEVRGDRPLTKSTDDFRINNQRIPRFFVDIDLHTKEILRLQQTPPGTGWGDVPTPMF
jgi:protein-S-isoprenylcysteine O-methyltransferase Ste14